MRRRDKWLSLVRLEEVVFPGEGVCTAVGAADDPSVVEIVEVDSRESVRVMGCLAAARLRRDVTSIAQLEKTVGDEQQ